MQLHDNFGALAVIPKLTPEIMQQIDEIFQVSCSAMLTWALTAACEADA